MQYFTDGDGHIYAYDDDVDIAAKQGPAGPLPNIPDGLARYTPTLAEQLAAVKARKAAEIRRACARHIKRGFVSEALGEAHLYPAGAQDQSNLIASVTASQIDGLPDGWTTGFRCVPPAERDHARWPLQQHTAAQIQQAGLAGMAWVKANQARLDDALDALDAITDADDEPLAAVAAVVWRGD